MTLVPMNRISIRQAAERGIERIRKPNWANSTDHVKLDIINGRLGPWLHLFSEVNEEINGRNPVSFLVIDPFVGDLDEEAFEPYEPPQ